MYLCFQFLIQVFTFLNKIAARYNTCIVYTYFSVLYIHTIFDFSQWQQVQYVGEYNG